MVSCSLAVGVLLFSSKMSAETKHDTPFHNKSTWKYTKSYREHFQLNSPNNFSANRCVVDSNDCTRDRVTYVLEKHSRITCFKVTN